MNKIVSAAAGGNRADDGNQGITHGAALAWIRDRVEDDAMNVFTYGSLMFPEVWIRVTGGGSGEGQPARLRDFEARRIRGQSYPALVRKPGAVTDGVLYPSVAPVALARLDTFEGDFYQRLEVRVETGGTEDSVGTEIFAGVYVAAMEEHPDILPELWKADEFRERHLSRFLNTDPGFSGGREL
jgi:gamma-glutamylcyclotransferase (GGCT)/AIG2-like uncharacterized protein YtfP